MRWFVLLVLFLICLVLSIGWDVVAQPDVTTNIYLQQMDQSDQVSQQVRVASSVMWCPYFVVWGLFLVVVFGIFYSDLKRFVKGAS